MEMITSIRAMQERALLWKRKGMRVGLVPTMGYLHDGHLSLVRIARSESDTVVVSIFVNPTQFLPGEDLDKYPRDVARDCRLCEEEGADVIFAPQAHDMYCADHSVIVEETDLSRGLCGVSRPGHFRGVTTVVAKLFNIVLPDVAVFGQKDAQQLRVVQRMVRDLDFAVRIVVGPIVREPDGLAMSSRNKYLSPAERREAPALHRALDLAESLFRAGARDASAIREAMRQVLGKVPGLAIEYIEIVDNDDLTPVQDIQRDVLVALAVRIGPTRLIDNCVLRLE
jgi:pantoate--beta-alanine ligase